jgi:UDP-N-acetylmuramoyl-tripeptide--D-alanyl-D-alanine ligase
VVIAGDMLELGDASEDEHLEMIMLLKKQKLDQVILVGKEFGKALHKSAADFEHFENVSGLKKWFDQQQFTDYYFLVKGSRLLQLEKLLS